MIWRHVKRNFPSLTWRENRPKKRTRYPRQIRQVLFFLGSKITQSNELGKTSRLHTVILLVLLLCRVHHVKCWAGWSTSWNQDFQEKYQQPQICRYHSNGRKWRGTKEPLDEGKRGEWKADLKCSIPKTKIMASGSHHLMVNRWGKSGNSVRLYFSGL